MDVKEEKVVKNDKEIKVRDDFGDMVSSIKFRTISNRFGERHVVDVTLWNNEVVEFKDDKKLFEICMSYKKCGETDFIKSKKLVEDLIVNEDGEVTGTYICVRYELSDGTKVVLFASDSFSARKILDNYYKLYKQTVKKS
ncbi:MAG: hypothetical protein IJZ77_06215 [Bacilli bacterium]|nr:hypothetical protein [Bacilli bacterium]MBQ8424591.1 hypothetical protein [Clostridia bacterium]